MNDKDYLRLIAAMVADIHHQVVKEGDVNSGLVATALWNQQDWAIHWEHEWLLPRGETPDDVSFVVNVLDMWSFIEMSYKALDEKGKEEVASAVPYGRGRDPKFNGFDGNTEGRYISPIRMLVDHMGRFEEFKGRGLNSHSEKAGDYAAMLRVFDPIRDSKSHMSDLNLTPQELISILGAPYQSS